MIAPAATVTTSDTRNNAPVSFLKRLELETLADKLLNIDFAKYFYDVDGDAL